MDFNNPFHWLFGVILPLLAVSLLYFFLLIGGIEIYDWLTIRKLRKRND